MPRHPFFTTTLWRLPLAAGILLAALQAAQATLVDINSPTTTWTPVLYSNNNPDPSRDQQTGSAEGDIVGNAAHPSAYTTFDNGNTPSLTDGTLAFRVRVGADSQPAGFKAALFFGLDGNADGVLDLFVGINNSGAGGVVGIWDPGAGLNVSPSTTSMVSTPLVSYTPTTANYSWMPVTSVNDPTVNGAFDLDGAGDTDHFLSFSIPFSDIVAQFAGNGIAGFNESSTMSYVISTATQANSLNQDLNGVGASYNTSASWSTLGVQSNAMTPASVAVVPEASSMFAVAFVLGLVIAVQHCKSRRSRAATAPARG